MCLAVTWSCLLFSAQLVLAFSDSNSIETNSTQPNEVRKFEEEAVKNLQKPLSVVSLKQKTFFRDTYSHFCTGSIISEEWILTAGHCFSSKYPTVEDDEYAVDVGTENLSNENGTRYYVSEFFIHPNQSESIEIYRHDLCLLKLAKPIQFGSDVQPVHFGTIKDQKELPVIAAGWGRVSQYGNLNKKLRYVYFKTLRYEECKRIHSKRNNLVDLTTQICGYGGPGKTLCFGDSGGPMFNVATGYQVAVFSSLEDCSGEFPVLFMKIEYYLDWINQVTKLGLRID